MIYLDLLLGFLEVGLFSFGGAYAAIPLIRDVVLSHGWLDDEMISYMIAVSESTPGPIMINMATYIGSAKGGIPGALIATTAVVLPAFFIIILIVRLSGILGRYSFFSAAAAGLKPCIIGIIIATGACMIFNNVSNASESGFDPKSLLITAGLAVIYFGSRLIFKKKGLSPIGLIGISALAGILLYGI